MSDIVERLREWVEGVYQYGARPGGEAIDLGNEAADEIERLRTQLAEAAAEIERLLAALAEETEAVRQTDHLLARLEK